MSGPPIGRREARVLVLVGFCLLVLQLAILRHLTTGARTADSGAAAPPVRETVGTLDPANILWVDVRDDGLGPPRSEVPKGSSFELYVRNSGTRPHKVRVRPQSGGAALQQCSVDAHAQQDVPLTLPAGIYIVEDVDAPLHGGVIEAK